MTRFGAVVLTVAVMVGGPAGRAAARELGAQGVLLGERASGMGGAFTALTGDGASSYYNPAGVAALYAKGISLSASAYQLTVERYPGLLDIPGTPPVTSSMASSTISTFPSSIVYVLPLDGKAPAPGTPAAADRPTPATAPAEPPSLDGRERRLRELKRMEEARRAGSERAAPASRSPSDAAPLHQVLTFSVLIPQSDKLTAKIETNANGAYDLAGTYRIQETTYWVGPSYGVEIGGRLRLGVSAFALAHLAELDQKIGEKSLWTDGSATYGADIMQAVERSGTAVTGLVQLGIQWDVTERLTFGATVRSPTLGRLYSSASAVQLYALSLFDTASGASVESFADRVSFDEGLRADYRRPLFAALGLAYRVPGSFTIALDGSFQARQGAYRSVDGEAKAPADVSPRPGLDELRTADPVELVPATRSVLNGSLGLEVVASPRWLVRLGGFTDLGIVERSAETDPTVPRLDRFGATLGLGRVGEKSTTSFGLVYVYGTGKASGLNPAWDLPANDVRVTSHTITATLSGSADL